ncbi:UNVERIFIED_CONTAM: hypothetical protein H355_013744 [Colinus virginianus]|nr:hypothetical protein H355_013744 [Colinus virginianus]
MAAKRRGVPAAGPPAAKRVRGEEPEFNGARFKALLRDPATAGKGLETFISTAKALPSAEVYDVVEGYVRISVECAEIFKLLDGEKKPESEMILIFQALEAILLRTASDLSHFSVVGTNIVKRLIHSYVKLVYTALYSENHRMSRVCLTLLSAMVAQGPDTARDVFSHFDFNNKFLPGLVKKRDKKGRPDVRMAYIQFALSFLIAGDNAVLIQVLELKDFIPAILRSGIKEDKVSTVNLLLSTLKTKVVQNKNITKTQKVRFFTAEVLNHVASLYRWNGITDVSSRDFKVTQGSEEVGKAMVRELVHNFLMDLCCSLKHGITFYDPSLGTSGSVNAWMDNMKLLKKLSSKAVKHSVLSLLSMVLKRALKNIEYCLNEETWQKSEIYSVSVMQEFVQLFREAISKLLPDMNSIVAVWQSLLKQGKEQQDGQEEKNEAAVSTVEEVTETTEVAEQHGSDDAETLFLKAALLQVICLYQKVVPHLVARSNFDFSKLLKGIVTEQGLREEVPHVLQYHVLKVALELPANKFAWFRVQDISETEKIAGEKSVFYLLVKMFVTSNHSHLKVSTKKLIIKILLKLVTNPYPYTDKAADLVQEASMLQVNMLKQDSDNVSIPISHIDGAHIVEYLVGVFTDLLHSQREALALCLMFQLYDKELQSLKVSKYPQLYQFNQYYNLWIPQQAQEPVLSKTSGPRLVDLFVDLLNSLLCWGNQIESDNRQKQGKHQAESDLFMDEESLITEESLNDKCRDQYDFTRPSTVVSAVLPVLRKALWKELSSVFQDTEASHEISVKLQVLSKLLPSSQSKGLRKLIEQLPGALEKAGNNESWTVADAISRVLENSEELHSWRRSLLSSCMKGLVVTYNSSKDESKPDVERPVLLRLEELLSLVEEVDPDDWYSLVKTGLKYRYRDEAFLKVLNTAIQLLYKKESSLSQRLVKLSKLHMMVTHHSLFLSAMLRSREEDGTNIQTREALVDILLTVVKLDPSVCESSHLAVLLGAYGATLSTVECLVACRKFVEVNALGLTVAALSSYDSNMRAAAYFVLASFRSHLEGARFREQKQHKTERDWVLRLLGEGLRDKHCYQLYDYQRIFHVILSFFNSPLCDEGSQNHILEVLQNAACVTRAAYELIQDHSLLTWILHILEKRFLENKLLNRLISLVHTLWLTNIGANRESKKKPQENRKFLPIQLVNEFLYVLIVLVKLIRSVLGYRALVVEAFKEMSRFTVNDSVLSNKEILLLLHKWSIIEKDLQLQEDVQNLTQKYQIKELLKSIKEKNKSQASSHHHTQKRRKADGEDSMAADLNISELEKCRENLNVIFAHWEPIYPALPTRHPEEPLKSADEAVSLTCASAYLVTKWQVKSMVEHSLSMQNVLLTLRWLQNCILPHPGSAGGAQG